MQRFLAVTLAAAVALALAACSDTDTDASPATSQAAAPAASGEPAAGGDPLAIGLIMLQGDTYFEGIQAGVEGAAEADGSSVTASLSNGDAATEATVAQNLIQSGSDAILMQPAAGDASLATMQAIRDAGIPLICYGNCLDGATDPELVDGVIQSDNTALGTGTGELAAKYIRDNLDGTADIGILNCDIASACQLRKAGFKQALEDAGVTATYVTDQEGYLADEATTVATNVLSANPDIDLLWAANEGGTVGATIAVGQSGKAVPVFGTDISTQLANFLLDDDGILQATTGQDPTATAQGAYEMSRNAVAGQENDPFTVELPGITFSRDEPDAVNSFLGS